MPMHTVWKLNWQKRPGHTIGLPGRRVQVKKMPSSQRTTKWVLLIHAGSFRWNATSERFAESAPSSAAVRMGPKSGNLIHISVALQFIGHFGSTTSVVVSSRRMVREGEN